LSKEILIALEKELKEEQGKPAKCAAN